MNDLEDIKEELTNLVFSGKKDEAVRLLMQRYGIKEQEAEKLLALAIKESMTPATLFKRIPGMVSGPKGCKKTVFGMIAFGFGFFGIPLLLAAIGFGIFFYYDGEDRIAVYGTVVENEARDEGTGSITYTPIVGYQIDKKEYTRKGTVYRAPAEYAVGDAVQLRINPEDPADAYIDSFSERWLVVVILGSVSFVFIILMLVFTFISRRL